MNNPLHEYYRCPEQYVSFALTGPLSQKVGYFRLGENILHGKTADGGVANSPNKYLLDVSSGCSISGQTVYLPFDAASVLDALRYESYHSASNGSHPTSSVIGRSYYFVRPLLPVALRKHLQQIRLNGWHNLRFPKWPVDTTVDNTLESLLLLTLKAQRCDYIPFIWFWPNGTSSCALMTHDVETRAGRDFCSSLMDINTSFGVKASFQVVPEVRYEVTAGYLDEIRQRGFEVNVQDLNHDGLLFRSREEFLERVAKINAYGRKFGANGFRSAILYRRQQWYDSLQFSYDMSVPNVAHLDPQRGGCCTVMPYFVGNLVELPVTMTQDYSLFHILEEHSLDLWKQQIERVTAKHGLIHFIVHPDYIVGKVERVTYEHLLSYLKELSCEKNIWMPLPGEAANWWRERSQMKLVQENGTWRIEGQGKERARIAYASERSGRVEISFGPPTQELKRSSATSQ